MEDKAKRVRVYSEEEKERRREAERKRMENPEYRERKRLCDAKRLEDKEIRARKQAMDRERQKRLRIENPEKLKAIEIKRKESVKYKEWCDANNAKNRERSIETSIGKICEIVLVKCLDCGCFEVKRPYRVKDGKASSAYCSTHAKAHRRSHGVDYKRFNIICSDCGVECIGASNRKVCGPCGKKRQKALKKTKEAIEAKRLLGSNHRRRAKHRGCYVDTVRPNIVFERDNWRCVECGINVVRSRHWQPNQATVDHAIPLSRGGSHTYENCQTMCMMCNSKKEATMPFGRQLTVFDRVA